MCDEVRNTGKRPRDAYTNMIAIVSKKLKATETQTNIIVRGTMSANETQDPQLHPGSRSSFDTGHPRNWSQLCIFSFGYERSASVADLLQHRDGQLPAQVQSSARLLLDNDTVLYIALINVCGVVGFSTLVFLEEIFSQKYSNF